MIRRGATLCTNPLSKSGLSCGRSLIIARSKFDPAVRDWIARGGVASDTQIAGLDAFFRGIRSNGLFSKLKRVNWFCGTSLSTGVLVPQIVGGGAATDAASNFLSSDYTEATGLTGNGTNKYLDMGASLGTILGASPPSTGGMGFYLRNGLTTASTRYIMGSNDGANGFEGLRYTSTPSHLSLWGGTAGTSTVNTNPGAGAYHVDRSADTNLVLYKNGASVGTRVTSITPASNGLNMFVFCRNNSGAANGFTDANLGGYWVTSTLSGAEALTFYNLVQTLMTALGRNV